MAAELEWVVVEPGHHETLDNRFVAVRTGRIWQLHDRASNHPPNPPTVHETLHAAKRAAEHVVEPRYTVYCCADATLTWAPYYASGEKIIPQALPVCEVTSEDEAKQLILQVGRQEYHPVADPSYMQQRRGKPLPPETGPETRYRYSLPNFTPGDVNTLENVRETLEGLRDADRAGDHELARKVMDEALGHCTCETCATMQAEG